MAKGITVGTKVPLEYKEKLDRIVRDRRKATGEDVNVSRLVREALDRLIEEEEGRKA